MENYLATCFATTFSLQINGGMIFISAGKKIKNFFAYYLGNKKNYKKFSLQRFLQRHCRCNLVGGNFFLWREEEKKLKNKKIRFATAFATTFVVAKFFSLFFQNLFQKEIRKFFCNGFCNDIVVANQNFDFRSQSRVFFVVLWGIGNDMNVVANQVVAKTHFSSSARFPLSSGMLQKQRCN